MCVISVIDVKPNIFEARDIKIITLTNSLLGNQDGFGYYLFDKDILAKSKNEALIYWRENFSKFKEENEGNYNGIYHVRKSSITYNTQNNAHLSDDKSHPFMYNDIIVAHNGYLNFRHTHINSAKYEKYLIGDLIDSQKFAITLGKVCKKGLVTFDNIKDALNLFGGAYALAIKGKQDNFMWLVRGKDRTLFEMTIFDGDNIVGKFINTVPFSQYIIGENLIDYGLLYSVKELKENTAYKYNLGNYTLEEVDEIKQDSSFYSKPTTTVNYSGHSAGKVGDTVFEDILGLMYKMGLIISDLIILSEIIFDKPIFILDDNEFKGFKEILTRLNDEAMHNGRIQMWEGIIKNRKESVYKLYIEDGIQYPYFMNTKNELKDLFRKSRREKENNELSPIQ